MNAVREGGTGGRELVFMIIRTRSVHSVQGAFIGWEFEKDGVEFVLLKATMIFSSTVLVLARYAGDQCVTMV